MGDGQRGVYRVGFRHPSHKKWCSKKGCATPSATLNPIYSDIIGYAQGHTRMVRIIRCFFVGGAIQHQFPSRKITNLSILIFNQRAPKRSGTARIAPSLIIVYPGSALCRSTHLSLIGST